MAEEPNYFLFFSFFSTNGFMHRNCEFLLMDFYSSELMQEHSQEIEPFSPRYFFPSNKISIANQSKSGEMVCSIAIRTIFINVHLSFSMLLFGHQIAD